MERNVQMGLMGRYCRVDVIDLMNGIEKEKVGGKGRGRRRGRGIGRRRGRGRGSGRGRGRTVLHK